MWYDRKAVETIAWRRFKDKLASPSLDKNLRFPGNFGKTYEATFVHFELVKPALLDMAGLKFKAFLTNVRRTVIMFANFVTAERSNSYRVLISLVQDCLPKSLHTLNRFHSQHNRSIQWVLGTKLSRRLSVDPLRPSSNPRRDATPAAVLGGRW